MANTITKQTLADGERNLIVKVHLASDGTEETDLVLIDVSDYNGAASGGLRHPWTEVKIEKIDFTGLANAASLTFSWDADANVKAFTVNPGNNSSPLDWCRVGGLINNAGTGKTGDILLTTTGLASGDELTFTLYMKKRS